KRGSILLEALPAVAPASVGGPQTICPNGTTVPLGGNAEAATVGTWSIVTPGVMGVFSPGAAFPNATFTETNGVTGTVVLRWTVSNACWKSSADVAVQIPADA